MLLNGKKMAQKITHELSVRIKKQKLSPGLAVILVGQNPASRVYVNLKEKACRKIGMKFLKFNLPAGVSEKKILNLIQKLNSLKSVHGIVVQMPLPKHLNANLIVKAVRPEKDVDGFGPTSPFVSPTHQGVWRLLKATRQNLKNKKVIILAKNPVFAEPLVGLLIKKGLKVSCYRRPASAVKKADVVIVALGRPKFIKPAMVKRNSIVIDVGYSRIGGKPCGDVSPEAAGKAAFLSPVPGGVGPLTVAYLLKNVYLAALRTLQNHKKC